MKALDITLFDSLVLMGIMFCLALIVASIDTDLAWMPMGSSVTWFMIAFMIMFRDLGKKDDHTSR